MRRRRWRTRVREILDELTDDLLVAKTDEEIRELLDAAEEAIVNA